MNFGKSKARLKISSDYEDLFKILNAYKVKYLLAGAYATIYYAEPRFTKDIDVWIIPDLNDAQKVYKALHAFGAPLVDIEPKNFLDKNLIYQIGVAPIRVDIMMDIPGVSFDKAWKNRKKVFYGKTPIFILGLKELILAKKKAGRPQDMIDLKNLVKKG